MVSSVNAHLVSASLLRQATTGAAAGSNTGVRQVMPFTARLILQPDVAYLAQTGTLARLVTAFVRIWINRTSNLKDSRLSPPQKKQMFLERVFMEGIGTPTYMIVMHVVPDLVGMGLQKLGFGKPVLPSVDGVSEDQLQQATEHLAAVVGRQGVLGHMVFNDKQASYGQYLQQLKQHGLASLTENPAFRHTAEQWFRKAKLGGSLTLASSMAAGALYGGVVLQKLNDQMIAPLLERRLYHVREAADA